MRRWRLPKYFPGWFVSGGGGGGLSTVTTTAQLTGAGTIASPLGIAGWPLTFYPIGFFQGASQTATANTLSLGGFVLFTPVTFANITVDINAADNGHNNDLGIYTAAGILAANIGAQHIAAMGVTTFATVQGAQTLAPGKYVFALTSAASTFSLFQGWNGGLGQSPFTWYSNASTGVSAGGALPNSISAPAVSVTRSPFLPWAALS